ncbi:MAG: ferric reductase-like transmembrane domain-containing protein [Gammaproteobacteria bacterium]|jgi:sulfoxide reductase heme-binding subunit YedZ|nr:ferric reductase-like transmembrane domain-containing protein [Gammaproteobacteria bacterium]
MRPKRLILAINLVILLLLLGQMLAAIQASDMASELRDTSGRWASYLLLATMLFTPLGYYRPVLRRYLPLRRHLGLWGFALAMMHLLIWVTLEFGFAWALMWQEMDGNLFIWLGLVALLLLVPLALTSNTRAMRKLGYRNWQAWHSLTYVAVPLALGHYLLAQKVVTAEPVLLLVVLVMVLVWRYRHAH